MFKFWRKEWQKIITETDWFQRFTGNQSDHLKITDQKIKWNLFFAVSAQVLRIL